ncbi:hypothetical protein GQ457_09G011740 [Hibiscus cannabinus]
MSISTQLLHGLLGELHSRRWLLPYAPSFPTLTSVAPPNPENNHNSAHPYIGNNDSFDENVVTVLSVLLCIVIFSLRLNSIIRCASSCPSLAASESEAYIPAQTVNNGIKRKALMPFPTVNYSTDLILSGLGSDCAICLSDFTHGDRVRILPMCNHGFHVQCIDKWLSSHSSCPKCRHCLDCSHQASSLLPPPVQETIVTIAPVEHEGLIHGYR